jgi:hypothetical protein
VPYRVPAPEDLPERLDGVLAVLYLVFNEGHPRPHPKENPMTSYLVLHMTDADGTPLPENEDQRMLESWAAEGEASGRLGSGAPVAGPERAKAVTVRDGRTLVTDGPFPEFKEWFAGYDVLEADSIDDAAAFMARPADRA